MADSQQKITIQSGYVLVERSEDFKIDIDEQSTMLEELGSACSEANCDKVLITGPDTKISLGPLDVYDLGKKIAALKLKIAIVETHDASLEDVKFLETIAQNRGSPIQFFDTEADAKAWLQAS